MSTGGGDDDDDGVFREAMRDVVPLSRRPQRARGRPPARPPASRPETARLIVEDDGEQVTGRAAGVSRRQVRELRSETIPPELTFDLHGLRADAARKEVRSKIADAHRAGVRSVRFIHGRGLHSGGRGPVLRGAVLAALTEGETSHLVRAFCTAARRDGGPGAINVWLAAKSA